MKKNILLLFLSTSLLFSDSFINLGNPIKGGFLQNQYAIDEKVDIEIYKDFKVGRVEISLSKNNDVIFDNLNKEQYKFLVSNLISTFGSPNSKEIFVYSWTDISGNIEEKACFKKKMKLKNVSGKSSCAISEELGRVDVDSYKKENSHILICKKITR